MTLIQKINECSHKDSLGMELLRFVRGALPEK